MVFCIKKVTFFQPTGFLKEDLPIFLEPIKKHQADLFTAEAVMD